MVIKDCGGFCTRERVKWTEQRTQLDANCEIVYLNSGTSLQT